MHGFTMALAQELANKGVTVNTVSPGYIGTDMVKAIRPDVLDKIVATIPVKRLGEPERDRLHHRLAGVARKAAIPPARTSRSTAACTWAERRRASHGRPAPGRACSQRRAAAYSTMSSITSWRYFWP